jgi:hypothetical protein
LIKKGLFDLKYDKDLPFITKKLKSLGMVAGGSGKKDQFVLK